MCKPSVLQADVEGYNNGNTVVPLLRDPPGQRLHLIPDRFTEARTPSAFISTPSGRPPLECDQQPCKFRRLHIYDLTSHKTQHGRSSRTRKDEEKGIEPGGESTH